MMGIPSNSGNSPMEKSTTIEIHVHPQDDPPCTSLSSPHKFPSNLQYGCSMEDPSVVDIRIESSTLSQNSQERVHHQHSSSPSSSSQAALVGTNEQMDSGQTKLLATHKIEGLEFIGETRFGTVRWKDMEHCIGREDFPENAEDTLKSPTGMTTNHPSTSRTRLAFNMNCNEKSTLREIKQAILVSASANRLTISQEEAAECARLVLEELDCAGDVGLCNQSQSSSDQSPVIAGIHPDCQQHEEMLPSFAVLLRAHWRRSWVVVLWLAACVALFLWKFLQYRHRMAFEVMGYCLCTAKGAAETLKLNMALVLLPVCRNTVTWLRRSRRINSVIPFNDNINIHKMIAGGIVIGVILHGGTHLTCDFPRIAGADKSLFRSTIADDFEHHQPSYVEILATTEGATGIAMVVLMIIAFSLATRPWRRRPGRLPWPFRWFAGFNAFWYSHHLFIAVYVLLIIHSMFLFLTKDIAEKTTWMYIAIPILIYAAERILRTIRAGVYDIQILMAMVYPGKVLSLKLQKPAGFRYRSGMYVFIRCPQISMFEWHPFSLTSAPNEDHLSLHIRTLGDWSYQIYSLFQEALASGKQDLPKIFIDGPYGASSQDYIKYDIVLLIGLGIGATPFISILKDITHGLRKPSSDTIDGGESCIAKGPLKAYFYWVTRDQGSFDWFKDIMEEISVADRKQAVIEMHNYLTSVFKEGDKRSAVISTIQALYHSKLGIDIISRTPVRTQFARPNWHRVFSGLASRHGGERIGVFYCGPETLGKELESLSHKMTTRTSTRFVFHKEHY